MIGGMNPVRPAETIESQREDFPWGHLRWFASRELSNTPGLTVGRCVIRPGRQNPRHVHPNCDEVLYLLSGRLEHIVGEDRHPMAPGDSIAVPAGVPHCAINVGDTDADMLITFSSGDRQFEPAPAPEPAASAG